MMKIQPGFDDVQAAHKRIVSYIHRTPVLQSTTINKISGSELFFKCENFQKAGAFKFRGATNTVFSLTDKEAARGVVTHSSGNHAGALSLAARCRDIPAYIVMPTSAPSVKIEAVKGYGGKITFCEPTLSSREATANAVIEESGGILVHPYNDIRIIAGQATAALEFLEDVKNLDYILTPVGGGGLLSGTAVAVKAINSKIKVFGCEPENADDAYRSFKAGVIIPSENPHTIADGLLTSLGELTFEIIQTLVDDIVLVSENEIIEAMRMMFERMKIVIEPSAAVPLGAILGEKLKIKNKRVGIILSGGNVDLSRFFEFYRD